MADETKFLVSANALQEVLEALNGPGYLIRELQFTRSLPGNAINTLIEQYNEQVTAQQHPQGATHG
jgi:hypothetical protein